MPVRDADSYANRDVEPFYPDVYAYGNKNAYGNSNRSDSNSFYYPYDYPYPDGSDAYPRRYEYPWVRGRWAADVYADADS